MAAAFFISSVFRRPGSASIVQPSLTRHPDNRKASTRSLQRGSGPKWAVVCAIGV
jgi:hypothetical protein